ncbi:hypothetical protein M422DRAFT_153693 [Sphaerobolus stellatus SS14]|nr:hypothetical protein M422DRAFT_153693 [Sphaerobolus stellatus SS14]
MSSTFNSATSNPGTKSKRGSKTSSASNQSLNHLLNFSLPPRQTHTAARRTTKKPAGYGARNVERFVNAQYRFMMKPSGDYTVHFADPDIFFQWHDVLQVIIPRRSAIAAAGSHREDEALTTCPICLSPPTAPRMTRCGHIFCYPCILHYLSTSEVNKWIRCPICFDSVNEKQLKSVKWYDGPSSRESIAESWLTEQQEYEIDLTSSSKARRSLRMRLMQRPHITTLALPRSPTWPSELLAPHQAPFHFLPDVFAFSKFMLATPSYLIADLNQDLDDLRAERRLLESMKDDLGIVFVDTAEAKVHGEMASAQAMDTDSVRNAAERAERLLGDIRRRHMARQDTMVRDPQALQRPEDTPEELLALNPLGSTVDASHDRNGRGPKQRRNVNPPPPSSSFYYYQSASGSPIYLHPLDNRILLSHFHNYASFPDEITVEVEAFFEGSVDDDLRKRCKYLALPEGADVVFVETDLEPLVGAEALKNFEGALKTRRTKRKDKARKDDRAKIRAEEKERERVYGDPMQWGEFGGYAPVKIPNDWSTVRPSVEAEEAEASTPTPAEQATSGAWGERSFASALHAPPTMRSQRTHVEEDEWDVDVAWHESQQRGGKRKQGRGQKLVILGGGSSGARRR